MMLCRKNSVHQLWKFLLQFLFFSAKNNHCKCSNLLELLSFFFFFWTKYLFTVLSTKWKHLFPPRLPSERQTTTQVVLVTVEASRLCVRLRLSRGIANESHFVSAALQLEWMQLSHNHTEETREGNADSRMDIVWMCMLHLRQQQPTSSNGSLIIYLISLISLVNYLTPTWWDYKAIMRSVHLSGKTSGCAVSFCSAKKKKQPLTWKCVISSLKWLKNQHLA